MDITNLDDHRKVWKTNSAACAACGHEWQAVYPVGAEDVGLECPACGSGLGSVLPNKDIVEKLRGASIYKPHETENLCEKASDEIERLREALQDICEVYAGSEGIPKPMTAAEGYLLERLMEAVRIAARALAGKIEEVSDA